MSIKLERIALTLGGLQILPPTTLNVAAGEVFGLTGPSGTGKTTALSIAGLLRRPDSGRIVINGTEVASQTPSGKIPPQVRQVIGMLPQNPRNFADPRLTLAQTICAPIAFRDNKSRPAAKHYREQILRLSAEAELHESLLERYPSQVSDGQLQRALLARSLSLDPKIILCDEPTSALDPHTTARIFQALRARAAAGASVIIASHDHGSLFTYCDVILPLRQLQEATSH